MHTFYCSGNDDYLKSHLYLKVIFVCCFHCVTTDLTPRVLLLTVCLCGIEGFAEFLDPLYIDWILLLQAPAGCFADEIRDG
jgi:hypothetical protein